MARRLILLFAGILALLGAAHAVALSATPADPAAGAQNCAQASFLAALTGTQANPAQPLHAPGFHAGPVSQTTHGDVGLASGPVPATKAGRGAGGAPGLAAELTRREAAAVFDDAGRLHPDVIAGSRRIIEGADLNPGVVNALTRDGSNIADWGKYSTQTFKSPSGPFQVHYYRNRATGAVNFDVDYKTVFNRR